MERMIPLLLLAGCAPTPDATLTSLKVHGVKIGASLSPDPYGYQFVGSADAALVRGTPVEVWGPSGSARRLPLHRAPHREGLFQSALFP
jgi:hypothetical protein